MYNGDVGKGLFFFGIGQVSIGTWSTAVDQRTANIARAVYMASWIWSDRRLPVGQAYQPPARPRCRTRLWEPQHAVRAAHRTVL